MTTERTLLWVIGVILVAMWVVVGLGVAGYPALSWVMPVLFVIELAAIVARLVVRRGSTPR